jgi:superfamily I DNA/RNA helicase
VAADEAAQVEYVVERVLEHREAGIDLKRQAVLFRAGHHSDQLEVELARRGIPFVKYGGLKFLEAAHVKDVLCVLRWIENPRDAIAGFRVLQLLPGVGPATARDALAHLSGTGWNFALLNAFAAPPAAAPHWPELSVRSFAGCVTKRRPGRGRSLWFVSGICLISSACTTMLVPAQPISISWSKLPGAMRRAAAS